MNPFVTRRRTGTINFYYRKNPIYFEIATKNRPSTTYVFFIRFRYIFFKLHLHFLQNAVPAEMPSAMGELYKNQENEREEMRVKHRIERVGEKFYLFFTFGSFSLCRRD